MILTLFFETVQGGQAAIEFIREPDTDADEILQNLVSQAFNLFLHPTNAILVSARQTWLLCCIGSE